MSPTLNWPDRLLLLLSLFLIDRDNMLMRLQYLLDAGQQLVDVEGFEDHVNILGDQVAFLLTYQVESRCAGYDGNGGRRAFHLEHL